MNLKPQILQAMRADGIPEGRSGLWSVSKPVIHSPTMVAGTNGRPVLVPPGRYTALWRLTLATMHQDPPAECVMNDMGAELRTHLHFCLRARGRVLITGLGLGCVLRGALANPAVTQITVLERDWHVIRLVRPHLPAGRFRVIITEAVAWCSSTRETFDCVWHDLWNDPDKEEKALALIHCEAICAIGKKAEWQGAWNFPRWFRRRSSGALI